ncbi:TPA: UxaA family hydrolase [Salmonella enterica subsp. enterica serovar Panama]|nr:UxaA family hydrolase [Salmonella enterica subsp. enterica serovar Panama]
MANIEIRQESPSAFYIKVHETDNVAIIVNDHGLKAGTRFPDGLELTEHIPQGHKVALTDIPAHGEIIRYGEVIGYAVRDIPRGSWIDESLVELPKAPPLNTLPLATKVPEPLPPLEGYTFEGYRNADGSVGTKNLLGITTSVHCVAGVVDYVVKVIERDLLPKYPNVDGVVGLNHLYGCGVAINAPAAVVPIRTIHNIALNPNFGGEVMVIGLGCEKLQPERLLDEMAWYDNYLDMGKTDRSANPSPGNKKGGLANVVEKALGSIAKSGKSAIVEVLSPGQRPTKRGLIYAATPASDFVCGTQQVASGITVQVFTTGRGTPYGLMAVPVIKMATRTELANRWYDLMDINAGTIATGEETIEDVGWKLFHFILDVASGRKKTFSDQWGLHNQLAVFNPAPVT